ncbi:MAG: bifunctional adenosylcobinamide hydrolase/alpha-ribazole phosphatase CbiS [Pyrodictiaceae archaeon]
MLLRKNSLKDLLIIEFSEPVKALSSTTLGGGLRELTHVVFHRVSENFNDPNPENYAKELVREMGLPIETTAVFLTAVDVVKEHVDREIEHPVKARMIATIGFTPLVCIGSKESIHQHATINILLVIDRNLSSSALVDIVSLIGSLKTLALMDLGLSCNYHGRAYSTATDAIIVASKRSGSREMYGGPVTDVGYTVSKLVYETIVEYGLKKLDLHTKFKNIFGVTIDWLVDTAVKLYMHAPIPNVAVDDIKKDIVHELSRLLKDPNIWALGLAARLLDHYGLAGTIPHLRKEEYLNDSKKILVDELLGIILSTYVNGWKGMFSYYWIDRIKHQLKMFKDKPMFIDDLLASIIGSILSRVYDKYLG